MMPALSLSPMTVAVILGVVALLCLVFLNGRSRRKEGFNPADYRAKALLTAWEVKALAEIQADLPHGYYACPQVRSVDAVEIVQRDPALRLAALGRVAHDGSAPVAPTERSILYRTCTCDGRKYIEVCRQF